MVFMVIQGSRVIFQGSRSVFMVFHGSRSVFMVFQGSKLVFHGYRWVFMVTRPKPSTAGKAYTGLWGQNTFLAHSQREK